ncbi:MAG TPA: DUF2207 domain-containing protein [Patescibacteria group bacterium]|nr:DUF2207 domain-containing protein [Patescibacteria group bacterium]
MRTFFCIVGLLLFFPRAWAQNAGPERILFFSSDITVRQDASLAVTETIEVESARSAIVHGIYRDFPTVYRDRFGSRTVVDFKLLAVLREGKNEPYRIVRSPNSMRVYIGGPAVLLSAGRHVYTLVYETRRQLGFFKKYDELYWNVTGNGWVFGIDRASAVVHLPAEIPRTAVFLDAYTGPQGAQGRDFQTYRDAASGDVRFSSTRSFAAQEGLTIVASWPKGFIKEPAPAVRLGYFCRDNRGTLVGLAGLLCVLVYYGIVWSLFGKDPPRGAVIPLSAPAGNMSPAAMRYLMKMGFDHKVVAAALIDMAVKGFLKITQEGGSYLVSKTGSDEGVLAAEEKVIARILFYKRTEIELKNTNHRQIHDALFAAKGLLKLKLEKVYFFTNAQYFFPGLALSVIVMAASAAGAAWESQEPVKLAMAIFISVWLSVWTVGVVGLVRTVVLLWRSFIFGKEHRRTLLLGAAGITFFALPFLAGELFGISMLVYATSAAVVVLLAFITATNFLFYYLLKAPTFAGRKVMDKIEGFKMYLSAAQRPTPAAQVNPDTFEKYLPYAFALDLEQAWSERFAASMQEAGRDYAQYRPVWYFGPAWSVSALSGSLSSAIVSSSHEPGSSSASTGGGSSGGGAGGGGGGGW